MAVAQLPPASCRGKSRPTFALDSLGLPEVISTSGGALYLHLPGVIVTEKAGQVRYLLPDGLGSVRQAVDETGTVVAYNGQWYQPRYDVCGP